MELLLWISIVLVIVFSVLRFIITPQGFNKKDIFKDFAHILVGFLLGAAIYSDQVIYIYLIVGFTLVEIMAFIHSRVP